MSSYVITLHAPTMTQPYPPSGTSLPGCATIVGAGLALRVDRGIRDPGRTGAFSGFCEMSLNSYSVMVLVADIVNAFANRRNALLEMEGRKRTYCSDPATEHRHCIAGNLRLGLCKDGKSNLAVIQMTLPDDKTGESDQYVDRNDSESNTQVRIHRGHGHCAQTRARSRVKYVFVYEQ